MSGSYTHSGLVRLLGGWVPPPEEAPGAGMDFAERLGLWVNAFDAISLQSGLPAIAAIDAPSPAPRRAARRPDLDGDLQRVRGALAHAIAQDVVAVPLPGTPPAERSGWARWQQRHAELQRQMDSMIEPLREHARDTLSRASSRLRQLAALDAALEPVIARRQQAVLPGIAAALKQRYDQCRAAGGEAWEEAFARDWRQALLAEVDLRLEPVAGLAAALRNELEEIA